MTSDITENMASPEATADASREAAPTVRPRGFAMWSLGFFALSLLLSGVAGLQILVPELVAGVGFLTYGKLLPVATNMFVYGWLTIGLAGALLYVAGVESGRDLPRSRATQLMLPLMAVGVIVGSVGIAAGFSEGRLYLEYPLWADVFLLAGFVVLAATLGRMTSHGAVTGPVRWYANAAAWWLVLAFVVGNIPGVSGVPGALQTSLFRASIFGLWLAAAAVAVVYHVIPKVAGRAAFTPTRLTVLGFWSLTFVWAFTAPANLTYSPASDWLETVGVVFSFGLLLAPMIIVSDLLIAMRGRWAAASGDVTLRFVLLGGAMLALFPLANLSLALRGSSAVLQFTDWVAGTEAILLYGAISTWLAAYYYSARHHLFHGSVPAAVARWHYAGTVIGLLVWIGSSLLAGPVAGWTWVASANDAAVPVAGVGFSNTLAGVEGFYIARFVGFVVFLIAQFVFIAGVVRGRATPSVVVSGAAAEVDPELVLEGSGPSRIRFVAVAVFVAAATFMWLIPWAEKAGVEASILADADRRYASGGDVATGRQIYLQEGCWYCHTQQVRPIVTDVGLGPVSEVGDYVYETPALLGTMRLGPDLMHAASRPQTDDPAWLVSYLEDPRRERSYSNMPAYGHLSDSDLADLAAYIAALR